jgi:outer membrane protein TolC
MEKKLQRKIWCYFIEKGAFLRAISAFFILLSFISKGYCEDNVFSSITNLTQCNEVALSSYLPSQIARDEVVLATLKITEARRNLFPAMAIKYQESKGVVNSRSFEGKRYDLELKQPISLGGKDIYLLKQVKQELIIAQDNQKKVKLDLYFEVAKAYYNFIYAQKEYSIYSQLKDEVGRMLNLAQSKLKVGRISELEFFNIKYLYEEVLLSLISVKNNLSLAELELKQKLNIEAEEADFKFPVELTRPSQDFNLDECVEEAVRDRPELRMARSALIHSQYGKKAAKAKGLPSLELTGKIGQGKDAYDGEDSSLEDEWFLGAKIDVPFGANTGSLGYSQQEEAQRLGSYYSGPEYEVYECKVDILNNLKYYVEKKKSEINHKKSLDKSDELEKKVVQEVRESYYDYQKARVQIEAAQSKWDFFQKDEELLTLKEKNRQAKPAELLDAKIKRAAAQAEYVRALADLNINLIALKKAQGKEG